MIVSGDLGYRIAYTQYLLGKRREPTPPSYMMNYVVENLKQVARQYASATTPNYNDMTKEQINRLYRIRDESKKWPISGKFNATERAIRKVRTFCREGGYDLQGLEYALALDEELSRIVNGMV